MPGVLLIDHYDSFTRNVVAWLGKGRPKDFVKLIAFDDSLGMQSAVSMGLPVVFSPGPKSPKEAQASVRLARDLMGKVPMLGICLGHQILAHAFGGAVERSTAPRHGMLRSVTLVDGARLTAGLSSPLAVAAYHSLVVSRLPSGWKVTGVCENGEIQAMECLDERRRLLAAGLQFHPDSFLTNHGEAIAANWWKAADSLFH